MAIVIKPRFPVPVAKIQVNTPIVLSKFTIEYHSPGKSVPQDYYRPTEYEIEEAINNFLATNPNLTYGQHTFKQEVRSAPMVDEREPLYLNRVYEKLTVMWVLHISCYQLSQPEQTI